MKFTATLVPALLACVEAAPAAAPAAQCLIHHAGIACPHAHAVKNSHHVSHELIEPAKHHHQIEPRQDDGLSGITAEVEDKVNNANDLIGSLLPKPEDVADVTEKIEKLADVQSVAGGVLGSLHGLTGGLFGGNKARRQLEPLSGITSDVEEKVDDANAVIGSLLPKPEDAADVAEKIEKLADIQRVAGGLLGSLHGLTGGLFGGNKVRRQENPLAGLTDGVEQEVNDATALIGSLLPKPEEVADITEKVAKLADIQKVAGGLLESLQGAGGRKLVGRQAELLAGVEKQIEGVTSAILPEQLEEKVEQTTAVIDSLLPKADVVTDVEEKIQKLVSIEKVASGLLGAVGGAGGLGSLLGLGGHN